MRGEGIAVNAERKKEWKEIKWWGSSPRKVDVGGGAAGGTRTERSVCQGGCGSWQSQRWWHTAAHFIAIPDVSILPT